jgi:putative peptide zinc metalloprotease protein
MIDALGLTDSGRALPLRRRADVVQIASPHDDNRHELVKDPVALRYYELPEEEAFLLRQFDGTASREEIRLRFERRFAPRRLDAEQLDRFVAQLFRQGLLVADRPGQGDVLLKRAREQQRDRFRRRLLNPLAITLPGIDPRHVLERLMPWVGWIFTRTFVAASILLAGLALATAITQSAQLSDEFATFAGSLTPSGLVVLAGVLAGMKVVHELAHAAACRRFGGECREIGVLLLVGIPALYCDVTGIWMVRERWKRVVVGAAGILAEMVCAAVALLLWSASEPGLFHSLCLQVAVVCSVATLLFNGNPLLRYDGYFILSDLVRITNLGEQADAALRRRLGRYFFGPTPADEEARSISRGRPWLPWYAAASLAYRLFITIGVLWLVRALLAPQGLTFLADLLAVVVLATTFGVPAVRGVRHVRERARNEQLDGRRFGFRAGACLLAGAAILFWPWDYRVAAPAIVRWDGATPILVATPGRLVDAVAEGTPVREKQPIATLKNPAIEREVVRLRGELREQEQVVKGLELRRSGDPTAGKELPTAQEALRAIARRVEVAEAEAERLVIKAPVDGIVLPVPAAQRAPLRPGIDAPAEAVPEPFDSPLDPRRRDRFLESGTPLCMVGDPSRVELVLVVDEREIEFVREQDAVRLQFDATGTTILEGVVIEKADRTLAEAPQELLVAGRLASQVDASGRRRSSTTGFQVRVRLAPGSPRLPLDAIGQAKIITKPQSLAERGQRWMSSTFRFAQP